MQKVTFPILFTTALLVIYTVAVRMEMPFGFLNAIFMLSPLVIIWMVIRVLKDGKPSERTFEEHFYEDSDYKRATSGPSGIPPSISRNLGIKPNVNQPPAYPDDGFSE